MKRIILASNSPQRKKLLSIVGLKFEVIPSGVDELMEIETTPERLVINNALLKGHDVARRLKAGIVIGADTIVYANKRVIGKPKTSKEARDNLKLLMSRPQWVYTGVVIIDAATKKEIIGYEKTKVFMLKLSDGEIARYHRIVPPFDKAGGFDIEGMGCAFIHRIEGDYTNVIGLPMAKVVTMLKKMGVRIL